MTVGAERNGHSIRGEPPCSIPPLPRFL
jgi:hypothetical protein